MRTIFSDMLVPIPIVTYCRKCHLQHVDEGEWQIRPHRTHQCVSCKHEWRPANIFTVGVSELP